jgi:hypothetical protein
VAIKSSSRFDFGYRAAGTRSVARTVMRANRIEATAAPDAAAAARPGALA